MSKSDHSNEMLGQSNLLETTTRMYILLLNYICNKL